MLEGRRLDAGRRAGRTTSPDFLRTIFGFRISPSESSSDPASEHPLDFIMLRFGSVADLEWAILRNPASSSKAPVVYTRRMLPDVCGCDSPATSSSTTMATRGLLLGELSRFCGIWLMASCSSFRLLMALPRTSAESSSSPDEDESGGDIMAPDGIGRLPVTGGGDCRRLGLLTMALKSSTVASGVS